MRRKYPDIFKEEVIKSYYEDNLGYRLVGKKYGLTRDLVRKWVKRTILKNPDIVKNMGMDNINKEKKKKYERRIEELEMVLAYYKNYNEILLKCCNDEKKGNCAAVRKTNEAGFSIMKLCRISGIARSSYYFYLKKKSEKNKNYEDKNRLKLLQEEVNYTYGSKHASKYMSIKYGKKYNHKKIARLMKEENLQYRIRRKKYPKDYYKIKEKDSINMKNKLNRIFYSDIPFKKMVTDITMFKVCEGWLYLNGIIDLFNGEVVSHAYSLSQGGDYIIEPIKKLIDCYNVSGMMLHSDQGITYRWDKYVKILKENGISQSFSRKGNCWDNAKMESFFSTLKCETIYLHKKNSLLTAVDMKKRIDEYIHFYNNKRIQKKLGYISPVSYRKLIA